MSEKTMDLKRVCEELQTTFKEMQRFRDNFNGEGFSAEDQENWDKLNTDFDKLSSQKLRMEEFQQAETRMERDSEESLSPPMRLKSEIQTGQKKANYQDPKDGQLAFRAWAKWGKKEITDEESRAVQRTGINPSINNIEMNLLPTGQMELMRSKFNSGLEYRAINTTATDPGIIDTEFVMALESALLEFGNMRAVSRIVRSATGSALLMPTLDDTGNVATIIGEGVALDEQEFAAGQKSIPVYKYNSLVKLSSELITDSAFNLSAEIGQMLGERLARGENYHYTVGTGSGMPTGAVTAAHEVAATTDSSAFVKEDVHELWHALEPAYRKNALWMVNDSIVKFIRLFVDDTGGAGLGSYLWQPGLAAGSPDTIFGKQVVINQDMLGAKADGNDILMLGDFSRFVIREVEGIRLKRLDELYMGTDLIGFTIFHRTGSDSLVATATAAQGPIVVLNLHAS